MPLILNMIIFTHFACTKINHLTHAIHSSEDHLMRHLMINPQAVPLSIERKAL